MTSPSRKILEKNSQKRVYIVNREKKKEKMEKFVRALQEARGELLLLKGQLFWFNDKRWDNKPGRVCLILDADTGYAGKKIKSSRVDASTGLGWEAVVQLLIDGSPTWVYVTKMTTEILPSNQLPLQQA